MFKLWTNKNHSYKHNEQINNQHYKHNEQINNQHYKHNEQINNQHIDNSECFGVKFVKIYPEMTSQ